MLSAVIQLPSPPPTGNPAHRPLTPPHSHLPYPQETLPIDPPYGIPKSRLLALAGEAMVKG